MNKLFNNYKKFQNVLAKDSKKIFKNFFNFLKIFIDNFY